MTQETPTPARHIGAPPPTILAGRYELGAMLGRGGMATVFAGRDVVLDRDVAVKVFPIDASDASQAGRFEQEARLLARLAHPGLVTVFDAGIDAAIADEPKPYLVMELVRGPTLAERIRSGPLSPAQTAALAGELGAALGHIHRRDIVHRDVKPANILLAVPDDPSEPTTAKLTDFGIARLVDGTRMTLTGFTVGTANYLSPEQLTGEPVTPASDIYSLGLVLVECLTGATAYPGHGAEAALVRLQRAPSLPPEVPDGWARLIRTMTATDPNDRPSAPEVAVAVTGLADTAPPSPTSAMPIGAPPRMPGTWVPEPAAADAAGETQILRTPDRAGIAHRRRLPIGRLLAAAIVAAIAVIAIVLGTSDTGGGPRSPGYPSVPGRLGTDLAHLQQDVAP